MDEETEVDMFYRIGKDVVKVGSVVQLKSGGPKMTVIGFCEDTPKEIYCVWFNSKNELLTRMDKYNNEIGFYIDWIKVLKI
jgi:uncharacterized protein YodC (DUF2158 family)